jgi:hypothetical protein
VVSSLCDRFNSCYSAWLTLVAARSDGAVVRYEDLTGSLDPLVERLARALGLAGPYARARVSPTCSARRTGTMPEQVVVDVDFEQVSDSRRRLTPLPSRLVEVVTERIDWQLVAPYGYAPMPT